MRINPVQASVPEKPPFQKGDLVVYRPKKEILDLYINNAAAYHPDTYFDAASQYVVDSIEYYDGQYYVEMNLISGITFPANLFSLFPRYDPRLIQEMRQYCDFIDADMLSVLQSLSSAYGSQIKEQLTTLSKTNTSGTIPFLNFGVIKFEYDEATGKVLSKIMWYNDFINSF